jgi:hypothetical protein
MMFPYQKPHPAFTDEYVGLGMPGLPSAKNAITEQPEADSEFRPSLASASLLPDGYSIGIVLLKDANGITVTVYSNFGSNGSFPLAVPHPFRL